MSLLAETSKVTMDAAPPCCDGDGKCDGESHLRLGASFTTGDLALLSFSIPAYQLKHPPLNQSTTKSVRVRLRKMGSAIMFLAEGHTHQRGDA